MSVAKSLSHKVDRFYRMSRLLGVAGAAKFEVLWSMKQPELSLRPPGYSSDMEIRRHSSDIFVFMSVFAEHELEEMLPKDPEFIVDGGANVGFTAAYYARRFPDATVLAIEPSAANCAQIRKNCASLKNVEVLHGALWSQKDLLDIENPNDESWAFRVGQPKEQGLGKVQAYGVDDILADYNKSKIDILKLDVEGAEREVFSRGYESWLPRVDYMLIEVHGQDARDAIRAACNGEFQEHQTCNEKILYVRR